MDQPRTHPKKPELSYFEASKTSKQLWESLQNILSNGEAWYLIQEALHHEVKEAIEKYELRAAQVSDGVERGWSEFEDEEQADQEVSEGDSGKTHFVGDDCPGMHVVIEEITDPYEK